MLSLNQFIEDYEEQFLQEQAVKITEESKAYLDFILRKKGYHYFANDELYVRKDGEKRQLFGLVDLVTEQPYFFC